MLDLENVKKVLIEASHKAGDFIRKEADNFDSDLIEYKDINNVVSYVDKEAEQIIVEGLRGFNPEFGFITEEETAGTANLNGYNWIIDPLDGTANFVHHLPHYAVSLALVKGREILAGVVYHIQKDETYYAVKNKGAFKNNKLLRISSVKHLNQSLLATGFPYYQFDEMPKYIAILEDLMQNTHGLRRFGSAALDLAYVAEGRYEGFFEYNLNSYDIAAGILLVKEAGGIVSDFSGGKNYLYEGNIVAGGTVQPKLLETIKKYWQGEL